MAPSCSKVSQIPRPIPEAPPVTNATEPEIFISSSENEVTLRYGILRDFFRGNPPQSLASAYPKSRAMPGELPFTKPGYYCKLYTYPYNIVTLDKARDPF